MTNERIDDTAKFHETREGVSSRARRNILAVSAIGGNFFLSSWPPSAMRRPFRPSMRKRLSPARFLRNRPQRPKTIQSDRSTSTFRKSNSLSSANVSRRRDGPIGKRSATNPRASGWRRCRCCCSIGAPATTGAT
jgi:hypothetical protein